MGFAELFQTVDYLDSLGFHHIQSPTENWIQIGPLTSPPQTIEFSLHHARLSSPSKAANNLKTILDMCHKTSPSLASCDFPWTALLLLAVESLLPLTVVSHFACLASVSFTGLSSSGFLCVETNRDKGLKAALHCTLRPVMHKQKTDTQLRPSTKTTCHNYRG